MCVGLDLLRVVLNPTKRLLWLLAACVGSSDGDACVVFSAQRSESLLLKMLGF